VLLAVQQAPDRHGVPEHGKQQRDQRGCHRRGGCAVEEVGDERDRSGHGCREQSQADDGKPVATEDDPLLVLRAELEQTAEESAAQAEAPVAAAPASESAAAFEPIRIVGVAKEGVSEPANDGTRGSALPHSLYASRGSRRPEWAELFKETWDHPPSFTTMHRPGIAYVEGDTIVLDGTDMQELEQYHAPTLRLVVDKVNTEIAAFEASERALKEAEKTRERQHRQEVDDIADRLDCR
jgi:hypothetical protein